jgi:predicted metal-dependent hydrolase
MPAEAGRGARADGGVPRRVALAGLEIDYSLVRARRRTIGIEVGLDGLTVRAPRWVSIREIEAALHERSRWIARSLEAWRGRRRESLPREWRSGATVLHRGVDLTLAVSRSARAAVHADLFHLAVAHPHADDESQVARCVGAWLRDEAWRLVTPRVAHFAAQLGRAVPPVKLSGARSEWGSCNHRGEIRLNWRLAQLPPTLADYVVAHEVAHLAELNHSPRFWATVESLLPGHAVHRRELREWTALLHA